MSKQYGCLVINFKASGIKSGCQQRLTKVIVLTGWAIQVSFETSSLERRTRISRAQVGFPPEDL